MKKRCFAEGDQRHGWIPGTLTADAWLGAGEMHAGGVHEASKGWDTLHVCVHVCANTYTYTHTYAVGRSLASERKSLSPFKTVSPLP